jgi:hypothetical protein
MFFAYRKSQRLVPFQALACIQYGERYRAQQGVNIIKVLKVKRAQSLNGETRKGLVARDHITDHGLNLKMSYDVFSGQVGSPVQYSFNSKSPGCRFFSSSGQ